MDTLDRIKEQASAVSTPYSTVIVKHTDLKEVYDALEDEDIKARLVEVNHDLTRPADNPPSSQKRYAISQTLVRDIIAALDN